MLVRGDAVIEWKGRELSAWTLRHALWTGYLRLARRFSLHAPHDPIIGGLSHYLG